MTPVFTPPNGRVVGVTLADGTMRSWTLGSLSQTLTVKLSPGMFERSLGWWLQKQMHNSI